MSISVRVSEEESKLLKKYAKLSGTIVSEVMRQVILSKIEDEFDIFLYEKAIGFYRSEGFIKDGHTKVVYTKNAIRMKKILKSIKDI